MQNSHIGHAHESRNGEKDMSGDVLQKVAGELTHRGIVGVFPASVGAGSMLGLPLQSWVYLATLLYTAVAITCTIINTRRKFKRNE